MDDPQDVEDATPWQDTRNRQEIIDALDEATLYTIPIEYSRNFPLAKLDDTLRQAINANRRAQQVVRRAMRQQREAATSLRMLQVILEKEAKK